MSENIITSCNIEKLSPEIERMDVINCTVHWGKNKYDVEIDLNEPLIVLKSQVYALTQVDPARQKIVHRGRLLKDTNWPDIGLKTGSQLRMVGTNDVLVIPEIVEEDKTPKRIIIRPPFGIRNYGNTCYMNSVIQVLRRIPQINDAVVHCNIADGGNEREMKERVIVRALSELLKLLDSRSENYEHFMQEFINNVENLYPEYSASIEKGGRPQQDANEFFMRIIDILKKNLNFEESAYGNSRNMIETLFGIDLEKTYKCLEKGGDAPKIVNETELQLSCFITSNTRFMIEGIKSKLNEVITMRSSVLEKDADFTLNTQITRLPAYLCVQYVRFFYKEQEKVNAKIMRDVKFPLKFDASELCAPALTEKFKLMRPFVHELENKIALLNDEAATQTFMKKVEAGNISLPEQKLGSGDSGSGIYQLIAVLTHEGRTTTSGHYIAWVKYDHKKWAKLDDATVTPVEEADILKLSGGGESHSSYLLLYKAVKIPNKTGSINPM